MNYGDIIAIMMAIMWAADHIKGGGPDGLDYISPEELRDAASDLYLKAVSIYTGKSDV